MTKYFDGKSIAGKKEKELKDEVNLLKQKGIVPKLVSFQIGKNSSSQKYLSLKKKAAGRIGIEMEIVSLSKDVGVDQITKAVSTVNEDKSVHGIMLQLPLPDNFTIKDRARIINVINLQKDIDGMRDDSKFIAPVVKAVMAVLESANIGKESEIAIVGANGFVGRKIVNHLSKKGYLLKGYDIVTRDLDKKTKEASVIISTAGQEGIIKDDMLKESVVLIDVGAPKGDIDKSSYSKSSYVSPVPGGIGPLTIYYLLENVVGSADNN